MKPSPPTLRLSSQGFTLIEMLTASAVLIIMIALLVPMFSSLTSSTSKSNEKLAVDLIARQALDRMGRDLAGMPLREDLDYFLDKRAGNDQLTIFTRVPGVLPAGAGTDPASGLTLVGYRVIEGKLERIALAQPFNSLTFLTYDTNGNLLPNTGLTRAMSAASDVNYHILCNGVFRFELGFLLKDGTYNPLPMDETRNPPSPTQPGFRRWTTSSAHGFAEVTVPAGPSSVGWRPLGWQDVAAIVVTLAVIDPAVVGRISPAELEAAAARLVDAAPSSGTNVELAGTSWRTEIESSGLGLPENMRNSVRIYQRAFYLNSP